MLRVRYCGNMNRAAPWSVAVAHPPTIAIVTDDALAPRLGDALAAAGYRTIRMRPSEITNACALSAFVADHHPNAIVYDAHADTVSPAAF